MEYRIAKRRASLGLRQEDLAQLSGLSQSQISRYEKGENDPTGQILISLAQALQTSVDWLLGITDDPVPNLKENDLSKEERLAIEAWRRGDKFEAIRVIVGDQ